METLQAMLVTVAWWHVVIYFVIGFACWYIMTGFGLWSNGYPMNQKYAVFTGFYEELLWHVPGGLQRRTERVREMLNHRAPFITLGGYPPEQIRNENRYEEVAKRIFDSSLVFWGEQVLSFFLWPLVFVFIILANIVGAMITVWDKLTLPRVR